MAEPLSEKHTCPECGRIMSDQQLGPHMLRAHELTPEDLLDAVIRREQEMMEAWTL